VPAGSSVPPRLSFAAKWRLVTSSPLFHLFVSAAVVSLVFIHPPAFFSGDTDTARNYLNTIVSSLSTILALCISIILVAIQLTASNYTHRVLDFYVRLPYNVSLFLFYLVTIMHSFFLMAKIRDPQRDPLSAGLAREMSADLVLVVICFLSLLVYMYAVVQLLKPERIINLVQRDYQQAYARGNYRAALDNVEQICDIAKRAASFSDSLTGMRCMDVMLEIAAGLPLPKHADDPLLKIHQNLVDQWVEIAGVAVKEKETGLLYAVLDGLQKQGELYVEGRAWQAAELVIRAYRHLSFSHLLAAGEVFYTDKVADRLYRLAHCAAAHGSRGETFAVRTWNVIQTIGENTFAEGPTAASGLLAGFLLSSEFYETLQCMADEGERATGLALYFQLWKAFAEVARRREVARWAEWWDGRIVNLQVREQGRQLALLISVHEGNAQAVQTLCHVWGVRLNEVDFARARHIAEIHALSLFDGWPWESVIRRIETDSS
jgi:hypothetical protein